MKYSKVVVENYREACGFFAGSVRMVAAGAEENIFEVIDFAWEGKGKIEETWDQFIIWKTSANR
jgi:hypothetical protein